MSIATLKRKTQNARQGPARISGRAPGGLWVDRGPFGGGRGGGGVEGRAGPTGFSLSGATRNRPSGDMKMSRCGTPFRGVHPVGHGGRRGRYARSEPLMNAGEARIEIAGNQWQFVKPSVLSTRGMLHTRYRWAYNGQYPHAWVQPVLTGNQVDAKSQGMYVHMKSSAADIHQDVNDVSRYTDYFRATGPAGCRTSTARYTMSQLQHNAPYTKTLFQPRAASDHTRRAQQPCLAPTASQQPFPYAVQTGTGVLRGGITVSHVASACHAAAPVLAPPPPPLYPLMPASA